MSMFNSLKAVAQTGLAVAQEGAKNVADKAKERVDQAAAGKRLLDEGGEPARNSLLAKKASLDVINGDQMACKKVVEIIAGLEDAAAKLRKAAAEPDVEGVSGKAEFVRIAEGYEARAKAYKQAAALLDEAARVQSPEVSPVEKDAMSLLQGQGYVQFAKSRTQEGLETAKQRASGYSTGSNLPMAPHQ